MLRKEVVRSRPSESSHPTYLSQPPLFNDCGDDESIASHRAEDDDGGEDGDGDVGGGRVPAGRASHRQRAACPVGGGRPSSVPATVTEDDQHVLFRRQGLLGLGAHEVVIHHCGERREEEAEEEKKKRGGGGGEGQSL